MACAFENHDSGTRVGFGFEVGGSDRRGAGIARDETEMDFIIHEFVDTDIIRNRSGGIFGRFDPGPSHF